VSREGNPTRLTTTPTDPPMKNSIQPGNVLTIVAAADIASGDPVLIGPDPGGLVGVACGSALTGAEVEVAVNGVFELPKLTTDVVAVGDLLYYDLSEAELTKTATNNTLAGIATKAAGNGVTTVQIRLNGAAKGS
jgi:predicted RecA/RadA family phage recombinase